MAVDLTAKFPPGFYRQASMSAAARELAAEVDTECVARALTEDIMSDVWPDADDPTFHEAVHRSVLANVQTVFEIMAGRLDLDATPEDALALAEVAARLGIPIGEVEKAYRVGVASLWSRWFDVAR